MTIAIYPGTFDPFTLGHLDIVKACSEIFEMTYVLVGVNPAKKPLTEANIRAQLIDTVLRELDIPNTIAISHRGLIVDFAKDNGAKVIVRGLRLVTDYEVELDISMNNRILSKNEIITVLVPPCQEHMHIRSSTVRELIHFGRVNQLDQYVPGTILRFLQSEFKF